MSDHDVSALNSLLTTVIDSIDGFEQASKVSETARFTPVFREIAADRQVIADEIEGEIRRLGGTPEEKGSMLASVHRVMIRLHEAVSSGDKGAVDEAERGEDFIKSKFEKAEGDEELSPQVRSFVAATSAKVRAGHDKLSALKHAIHAEA